MVKGLDELLVSLPVEGYPVNVGTLVERLSTKADSFTIGYEVIPLGVRGTVSSVGGIVTFCVNASDSVENQRVTLGYCLGWFLYCVSVRNLDSFSFEFGEKVEGSFVLLRDAGVIEFVYNLLMPRRVISDIIVNNPEVSLVGLANFFGVTLSVMDSRLSFLGYV